MLSMRIQVRPIQAQKLMLIRPSLLALWKSRTLLWGWRRICNLGNQIRSRRLRNTIDEDAQQRDTEEDVKPNPEPEQQARAVIEPPLLLRSREVDTAKVRLEQLARQAARGKVRLQEDDEVATRKEDAAAEDEKRGAEAY
ncbi:hypothetical protein O988_09826 [Pseudogymnoascus sp. VKM F-3808]|nr:hypothetical protein O988_09826 [Pseudogymnoascus sp. VKM F-3808]